MNSMSGEKLKGIPYTGTLPATLTGTKAGYLHRYKIYGNTEQTGTPTPKNPIYPSECGERTGNLFDISQVVTNAQVINQGSSLKVMIPSTTTGVSASAPNTLQDYCPTLSVGDEVTLSFETTGSTKYIYLSGENIAWTSGQSKTITATMLSSIVIWYASGRDTEAVVSNIMLNLGSTPLPYEPYGYKLPLLSGSTPVDIYLGESQTTRRIKKLVLTGTENWVASPSWNKTNTCVFYLSTSDGYNPSVNDTYVVSSYYAGKSRNYLYENDEECCAFTGSASLTIRASKQYADSQNNFLSYLQQQYANGTPVTVWYVLENPETSVVNEPLRKIGDYADTIDSTQTSAQIPTSANSTTISWGGQGLEPSEFDSIQEWVDIPTYKRVNGEWVTDN